jgi:hypothetical protein
MNCTNEFVSSFIFLGLPPYAHENNSLVGLKAAIQIRFGLLNIFEDFSIGVSTGMAWCGGLSRNEFVISFCSTHAGIGNTVRSDYAVVRAMFPLLSYFQPRCIGWGFN